MAAAAIGDDVEQTKQRPRRSDAGQHKDAIHCIMITGKDDCRIELARLSVQNFLQQDHSNKRLLILNHHPSQRVLHSQGSDGHGNKIEQVRELVVVKSPGVTLGALRNVALDQVPDGELWTVWDDDDWRGPAYLTTLLGALRAKPGATAVAFTDRLEYNHNTGLMWGMRLRSGFVTMLATKLPGVRYLDDRDSMEDVTLKAQYGAGLVVLDNARSGGDNALYVRLVHGNNTSLYVNKNKTAVVESTDSAEYRERDVTPREAAFLRRIISTYFSKASCLQQCLQRQQQ